MEQKKAISIIDNIKNIFDNIPYSKEYSFDIWFTILVIFLVSCIVTYLYVLSYIKSYKTNWETYRCNPLFMPFASLINSDQAENDPNFTINNFNSCLNDINKSIADDAKKPITNILNTFSSVFSASGHTASTIMDYIANLFTLLVQLFSQIIAKLKLMIGENNKIFIAINDFINEISSILSVIYYSLILIVDSIKLILPIAAMSFMIGVVLPAIISVVIAFILFAVFYAIAQIPIFGSWAHAIWPGFLIMAIIATAFMILVIILYAIFAKFASDVLAKTLRPMSSNDDEVIIPSS